MAEDKRKQIKIHNKSDKPDNIVMKEHEILQHCQEIEAQLPSFLRGFFNYLKGNVLPMTRLVKNSRRECHWWCSLKVPELLLVIWAFSVEVLLCWQTNCSCLFVLLLSMAVSR